MKSVHSSRRDFLRHASAATAASWLTVAGSSLPADQSKNDRLRIGCIGLGGRGLFVAKWAAQFADVVAVCDVDRHHAEQAKAALGGKADIVQDYRRLLDRHDVDAVLNATPDHWHTAINLAACKAGKDVYAEKPLTLTIDEGKRLCQVVEQTGRIVQVGAMQRSDKHFQTAVELVRNGRLGKLHQVWVALPYLSTKGGPFPSQPVPSELNWDMYQGQSPRHDYCSQRTHRNFRWWYEYSGGMVTDWGNHHVDIAHWGIDCELTGPTSVEARGLFPNPQGPQYFNTPDRFFSRMTYPNGVEVLLFSSLHERWRRGEAIPHKDLADAQMERIFDKDVPDEIKTVHRDGITFLGDRGRIFVNRGGVYGKAVDELKESPLPSGAWRVYPSTDHMANFFQCVNNRKQPCATVQVEHRTITACHLTNISLRLNRKIAWDPQRQEIVGDAEANAWLQREQHAPYQLIG